MLTLEEGERRVKVVRRHFLVLLPLCISIIFGALFPFLLYSVLISHFVNLPIEAVDSIKTFVSAWEVFGYSIWLLMLWLIFFVEWTDYYLDMLVITDKRILDIEQKGFFRREVTSYLYSQIQDITIETDGIARTIFKFGDLHIQTAGQNHEIIVRNAADPEKAKSIILNSQILSRPSGL